MTRVIEEYSANSATTPNKRTSTKQEVAKICNQPIPIGSELMVREHRVTNDKTTLIKAVIIAIEIKDEGNDCSSHTVNLSTKEEYKRTVNSLGSQSDSTSNYISF